MVILVRKQASIWGRLRSSEKRVKRKQALVGSKQMKGGSPMKRAIIVVAILMLAAGRQSSFGQSGSLDDQLAKATPAATVGTVHQLPFASVGNSIELSIANGASLPLSQVTVEAAAVPGWIRFKETRQTLPLLKANQELPVLFTFSVDKKAPVGKEETIAFRILSSTGETWAKEIRVKVAPPERFELFHNYPNPFNPTTTISYQLPTDSRVSLKIYNLLGQQIAVLADEDQPAGYHQAVFEAGRFSTGMYVYRLSFTDQRGDRHFSQKRMILLK